jgi:hypothetical protein
MKKKLKPSHGVSVKLKAFASLKDGNEFDPHNEWPIKKPPTIKITMVVALKKKQDTTSTLQL